MQETAVAPPAPQTDAVVTEPEAADSPDVDAPPELVAIAFPSFFQILDVNGGGLDPVDDEAAGARGRGFGPWCLDHGAPRGLETFNRRFDSRGHARLKPVEEVRARHADSEITPP